MSFSGSVSHRDFNALAQQAGYQEFLNGTLGAYSTVSGNPAIFTQGNIAGIGACMQVASQNAGAPSRIRRSIPYQPITKFWSVAFQVTALNADDAAQVEWWESGTFKFGFIPIREAAIDPARRAQFISSLEDTFVTAGQLTVNTWYLLQCYFRPGAGQSIVRISELLTGTLVNQANLVANYTGPATDVNQLAFDADSGGVTCPVNYTLPRINFP